MERYKVGIIGNGFVGEAQAFAYSPTADIKIYDIDPLKSTHTLEETCQSDFVFIAVPTPMNQDGSQNLSYIEDVFKKTTEGPIYIIKSTVLPGTTQKLIESFPKLNIIFSPEFLTERTAKLDMLTQARIILGGERNNTFFATKVSIINEFKRMSDALGTNWQDAIYGFSSDGRIGDSHLHVPGPDGKLGYGGTCFPKDVNALITMGSKLKTPMNTLEAGWKTNLEVRPESDWENLKGRAVSEK